MATSVLRMAGEDDHILSLLRDALVSHFDDSTNTNTSSTSNNNNENNETKHFATTNSSLNISNRYFKAFVSLKEVTSNDNQTEEEVQTKEDGIVLVFDSRDRESTADKLKFESVSYYHEHAEKHGQCGDLLRLCVGVTNIAAAPSSSITSSNDGSSYDKAREEEYSRRVLWCLDRGYEYVEVDLSTSGINSGHDERDKDGFARVAEAVGTTVWSSSIMHPKKKVQLDNSYKEDKIVAAASSTAGESTTKEKEQRQNEEKSESVVEVCSKSEASGNIVSAVEPSAESESHIRPISDGCVANESLDQEGGGKQEEAMFDHLEHLMTQASQIRDAARTGELSDEQRRERAGETAMKLMGLLDRFDLDDDDGEDDSDSDSHQ